MSKGAGGFTLPGEAGYEALTFKMAEKWGADVIRDSDGTNLSQDIIDGGYGIYSTICLIRDHNEWAKKHLDMQQQTFLMTQPKVAKSGEVEFGLMDDFFEGQFQVNSSTEALGYWQLYDRTANREVPSGQWKYKEEINQKIQIRFI